MKINVRSEFEQSMAPLSKVFTNVNWKDREVYGNWLAQTFYYVSHSTRLLALTAAHCALDAQKLHNRFVEHLREEKGHENLATKDLAKLGFSIADFPETAEISAFYQTQYYWIQHKQPISFYGYILCLEGLAVNGGGDIYKVVADSYGKEASMFLKIHAAEDIEHLKKAFENIEALPENELNDVMENFKLSCKLYANMLTSLGMEKRQQKKSA